MFTAWDRRGQFAEAVAAVVGAYQRSGLDVTVEQQFETFARLNVTEGGRSSKVELGVDWRAKEPILMSIGPVLHPDDAMANKMSALYGRALARDFVDIDAAIQSGHYDHETLLRLAQQADRGFDRRHFADALGRAEVLSAQRFADYGFTGQKLDGLRARFAAWRAQLLKAL